MKRISLLHIVFLIALFLSGCSSKPSFELIKSNISIVNDKEKIGSETIIGGALDGEEIVATALYYEILIKRTGSLREEQQSLEFYIEPNDDLIEVCKKEIGFNIYEEDEYNNSGLGYGRGGSGSLDEDTGEVLLTFFYDLGVSEKELSKTHHMLASKESLENLLASADNAKLIVKLGDKEIKSIELIE